MCNNLSLNSDNANFLGNVSGGSLGNNNVKSRAKLKTPDDAQKIKKRFALLWKSKAILKGVASKNILGCMSNTLDDWVEVDKSDGHANFHNIVTCKSKHVCPVESPSIAAVEAKYIQEAIKKCRVEGNDVYMLTLTFRHNNMMSLKYCMDKFHEALQLFWKSGSVRRFYNDYFFGRITSLEVTWNEKTGWHVHEHILLFGERGLMGSDFGIGSFFAYRWCYALERVGLSGVEAVASQFQSASAVKDYLVKMSLELTMQHFKEGRAGGHYTPFQILDMSENPNDKWADLWREFYLATKGKRVVVWSDGLKARYGIKDKSDDEIADEANEDLEALVESVNFFVEARDWRYKVCSDSYNLAYLKSSSIADAAAMLDALGCLWGN